MAPILKKAVILLSGGLDSSTCLALAKSQGFACYAMSFDYQQKHYAELEAAKRVALHYQVQSHAIIPLPVTPFASSAAVDPDQAIPAYKGDGVIPTTYVPARNTVFLSLALGWAEVVGAEAIFIGSSAVDYSGYPDCRPAYFEAFQKTADLATKAGIEGHGPQIHTPLVHLSKAQTIELGLKLGVDYSLTVTCYQANAQGQACGGCDSCVLRKKGFAAAGVADPTSYA